MKECSKCGATGRGSSCPKCGGKMQDMPLSKMLGGKKAPPKYADGTDATDELVKKMPDLSGVRYQPPRPPSPPVKQPNKVLFPGAPDWMNKAAMASRPKVVQTPSGAMPTEPAPGLTKGSPIESRLKGWGPGHRRAPEKGRKDNERNGG